MEANSEKLHQCNERTPLRTEPLLSLLTKFDYTTWESFLQGEIPIPENLEEGTRAYLEVYHNMEDNDIDILHTPESLKKAWSKAKEKTSAAPGPIHYGTMKVMKWCMPLAKFQTIMANIPLKTSATPSKWSEDVEVMLLKKKDNYLPEKLRRIGLMDVAFNMNNKHIGRAAMRNAEELDQLAIEQYGSRNNLSAEKHALNKRLMLDIMRVSKTPGVLIANDAKSCYDRILHFATYAALRRAGIPKEAVISMVHTLRTMKHRVRTGYGDSIDYYGGEDDGDPHGTTQGNGAGPAIWALVSSPLLDILREKGYGAKLLSPIRKEFFHLCGFAFVDDTDTIQTGEIGTPSEELLIEAQLEMNLWENLIRATGGAIEGDKSDYTVINWKWKHGKAKYEPMNSESEITCLNSDGQREVLKQIPADEARRTLGVWQAANGQEDTQVEKMKAKANDWANSIYKSNLSKSDIAMGVKTSLYPSITYGLVATALTEKQAGEIFKPIREKVLPKMKICRQAPAIVVHGPEDYGGLEIKDLYILQGIAHIKALIDEGESETTTGKLLRNLIEQHVVEVGLSSEPSDWSYEATHNIITDSWFKNTLEFMEKSDIRLFTGMKTISKWTKQDAFIMEDVIAHGIKGYQLEAFNRCRMHLQAMTMSDISGERGTEILMSSYDVHYTDSISSAAYNWPAQPRPPTSDVNEWKKVLHEVYGITPHFKQWRQPVREYMQTSCQHAKWRYEEITNRIYERMEDGNWKIWSGINKRARTVRQGRFKPTDGHCDQINHLLPIARIERRPRSNIIYLNTSNGISTESQQYERDNLEEGSVESNDTPSIHSPSFEETLDNTTDKALMWALEELNLPRDQGKEIATSILANEGRCMSDGSLKDLFGTSAFTFLLKDRENGYVGRNRVPGQDLDQSSYRSELCGILGNIMMINAICKHHGITGEYTVKVGCDSESALWNCFGAKFVSTKMASFDLVKAIRYQIATSPIKYEQHWVKAHQDDTTGVLDTWALANIECDNEATRMWNKCVKEYGKERPEVPGKMPGEEWVIWTEESGRVCNNIDKQLYNHALKKHMIDYWEHKERVEKGQGDYVDWEAHSKAMKTFGGRKLWITKHCSGWAGSGVMMAKWKMRDNAKCPRCDTDESTQHVVQCQAPENKEQFKESMEPLKTWLTKSTSPRIASAVRTHMNAYQKNRKVKGFRTRDEQIRRMSEQQDKLGIRSFGEGFLAKEWREAQARHYGGEDAASKSKRWTTKLIQKIWEVSWDMWQARNYLIHYNKDIRDELFMERINADIEVLWTEGRSSKLLYHPEKQFFTTPLDKLLQKEEYNKVRWIEIAERYLDPEKLAARETSSQGILMRWLTNPTEESDTDQPPPVRQYVDLGTPVRLTQRRIVWSPHARQTSSSKRKRLYIDGTSHSGVHTSQKRHRLNEDSQTHSSVRRLFNRDHLENITITAISQTPQSTTTQCAIPTGSSKTTQCAIPSGSSRSKPPKRKLQQQTLQWTQSKRPKPF